MRTPKALTKELLRNTKKTADEDLSDDSLIAQTVSLLIEDAIESGASSVHIEPREDYVAIRYRIDGILKETNRLPKSTLNALTTRIKILSDMKIDDRLAPQDGSFKACSVTLRVSVLPIADGEKIVMRVFNESHVALSLEELGYWGHSLDVAKQSIAQPHGIILVTGPAGSGKSTTLFSLLSLLSSPNVNICTIEDEIEYRMSGVNQTQINSLIDITFSNGLRALLRQNPNVVMIGEIRDSKTAELAIETAVSKRLVFSALHTKNASTALVRLRNMGIESFLIANAVRAIIGQRLVRRLCEDCREAVEPDAPALKRIEKSFRISDMKQLYRLEAQALAAGIGKTNISSTKKTSTVKLSTSETKILRIWKAHEGGCENCNYTGYKGRVGIYEVLGSSPTIQKLIVGNGSSETIQDQARKEGMVTMQLDGLIKALRGQTSIDEVLRVQQH